MERIIGGLNLPLPDALPDKRIYELLKTVDLENLTFADFQGVAKTIYAEQGAEDELRRIVLVNLARLAVKGNWDGLTTSASGGVFNAVLPATDIDTGGRDDCYMVTKMPPWGFTTGSGTSTLTADDSPRFYPWVSPKTGSPTIRVDITSSTDNPEWTFAIYSDSNGVPNSRLATADYQMAGSTGVVEVDLSDANLVQGTQYWIGYVRKDTSGAGTWRSENNNGGYYAGADAANRSSFGSLNANVTLKLSGSNNTLPSSVTATSLQLDFTGPVMFGVRYDV